MRRHILEGLLALVLLTGCNDVRQVRLTFGAEGEGLDGFLCREDDGDYVLSRAVPAGGGAVPASLVIDFVRLGGLPGCRSGQLVSWCADHDCAVMPEHRVCIPTPLPDITDLPRAEAREEVREALRSLSGASISSEAPDEFIIVRTTATLQSCDELEAGGVAALNEEALVGCAYSCPVSLNAIEGDVYLGFDTLTEQCAQGVRVCASGDLHWRP
ncbi:hypothetical protein [Myxococcus sp. SDU36]|uniref:hypothetical protein n=1 Tax=Myxococcus sp. SDU36 TaxID=2831967 RepID=UPI002542D701|nr:hypothetical protein [Myxococcus sp. SDU36]WIG98003.1 hypothetical protein KGD87_11830 [Myxococcus sp. SDU36]